MTDQNSASEGGRDLFGNPIVPIKDRRGRPSFKKSKENQDFVAVRAASGWSQDMIAEALGCDPKTLRKNFSRELVGGQLMIEGLCLDVLLRRAREGHVPSVRALQDRMDRIAPPAPKAKGRTLETGGVGDAAGDSAAAKGKKELQIDGAKDPGAEYGDLYSRLTRQ